MLYLQTEKEWTRKIKIRNEKPCWKESAYQRQYEWHLAFQENMPLMKKENETKLHYIPFIMNGIAINEKRKKTKRTWSSPKEDEKRKKWFHFEFVCNNTYRPFSFEWWYQVTCWFLSTSGILTKHPKWTLCP